jgi:hypothetical protein
MEEKPQEKPDEETIDPGTAAKRKHDAEVVDLQTKIDAAKRSPSPKTAEAPPTPQELAFLDKIRKVKQYSRDALMLNLLLDRQVQSRDLISGVYGIIEHQHAQDRFLQESMAQTSKEQTRIRATIDDAVKSASEEDDGLRERLVNLERIGRDRCVEAQERLDYLENHIRNLFSFLHEDRAWQDTPRLRRRRKNRGGVPKRITLEEYLDAKTPEEDLPERLQKAADSLVVLAVRVATSSAAGAEERQPLPPSVPLDGGAMLANTDAAIRDLEKRCGGSPGKPGKVEYPITVPYCDAGGSPTVSEQDCTGCPDCWNPTEPIAVVPPVDQEKLELLRSNLRQGIEDGLAKAKEKKRAGSVAP